MLVTLTRPLRLVRGRPKDVRYRWRLPDGTAPDSSLWSVAASLNRLDEDGETIVAHPLGEAIGIDSAGLVSGTIPDEAIDLLPADVESDLVVDIIRPGQETFTLVHPLRVKVAPL